MTPERAYRRDNGFVDENENSALARYATRRCAALVATIFGIYELPVICASTVVTTSLLPAQSHQSAAGICLWHGRSNLFDCMLLTALVVATALTVVSLYLRRYVRLICRIWWIEHLMITADGGQNEVEKRRQPITEMSSTSKCHHYQKMTRTCSVVLLSRTRMAINRTKTMRTITLRRLRKDQNNQALVSRNQRQSPRR
jgi:hypothetical protein